MLIKNVTVTKWIWIDDSKNIIVCRPLPPKIITQNRLVRNEKKALLNTVYHIECIIQNWRINKWFSKTEFNKRNNNNNWRTNHAYTHDRYTYLRVISSEETLKYFLQWTEPKLITHVENRMLNKNSMMNYERYCTGVVIDGLIIRNSSYRLQLNCQVEHRLNGYLCNRDQLPTCKRQITCLCLFIMKFN